MAATYSKAHAGCYVDGARGIYAINRIVSFAMEHGWQSPPDAKDLEEFPNEIEDEADAYMNETFPVEGARWGRSEQGDWGLWATEEEE